MLTVDPSVVPAMVSAATARAASDEAFRSRVNTAAVRVLTGKATYGLFGPRLPANGGLNSATISASSVGWQSSSPAS